jgi:hypothetical protein
MEAWHELVPVQSIPVHMEQFRSQQCAAWCLTELIVQFDACICKGCAYDERCAL